MAVTAVTIVTVRDNRDSRDSWVSAATNTHYSPLTTH